MSADELIQQFLAVASRASQQGKTVEAITGCMEIAKHALIARTVKVTVLPTSGIVAAQGHEMPTREQLRNQPKNGLG